MGRFDTVRRKVVDLRAATARSHRTGQYPLAKALAGDQERLSGDHRSCRPECSGVVSAGIGVGLNNRDAIDCRPQFGGRDLLVNRSGSVAELSGADVHDVPTVGLECDGGVGEVTTRRDRRDHGNCHAPTDLPTRPCRCSLSASARQCTVDEVDALVQSVAAEFEITVLDVPVDKIVSGYDDVSPPKLEGVHAETISELIHGRFDGEDDLAEPVTTEGAGRNVVRVDRFGVDAFGCSAIDRHGFGATVEHDSDRMVPVRPGVGKDVDGQCSESSVGIGAGANRNSHRVP